jgi:hypothetical protein
MIKYRCGPAIPLGSDVYFLEGIMLKMFKKIGLMLVALVALFFSGCNQKAQPTKEGVSPSQGQNSAYTAMTQAAQEAAMKQMVAAEVARVFAEKAEEDAAAAQAAVAPAVAPSTPPAAPALATPVAPKAVTYTVKVDGAATDQIAELSRSGYSVCKDLVCSMLLTDDGKTVTGTLLGDNRFITFSLKPQQGDYEAFFGEKPEVVFSVIADVSKLQCGGGTAVPAGRVNVTKVGNSYEARWSWERNLKEGACTLDLDFLFGMTQVATFDGDRSGSKLVSNDIASKIVTTIERSYP